MPARGGSLHGRNAINADACKELAVARATAMILPTTELLNRQLLALFDPQLIVLGPAAWVILDNFGARGYMTFALVYPAALGLLCAALGYFIFRRGDLP